MWTLTPRIDVPGSYATTLKNLTLEMQYKRGSIIYI